MALAYTLDEDIRQCDCAIAAGLVAAEVGPCTSTDATAGTTLNPVRRSLPLRGTPRNNNLGDQVMSIAGKSPHSSVGSGADILVEVWKKPEQALGSTQGEHECIRQLRSARASQCDLPV